MISRTFFVLCVLAAPTFAVVNTKADDAKIERREAPVHIPFDTYGPPPAQPPQIIQPVLPTPVYGAPAVGQYPPPPPDKPPALSTEYGIPVKYGPPKVHIEYGPPPVAQSVQQSTIGNHHHHQVINHHGHGSGGHDSGLSFFEQIKQTLGFSSAPQHSYPSHQPHTQYGPPPSQYGPPPAAPVSHFVPPKPSGKYGPPPKQSVIIISKPQLSSSYGPPPKSHAPATSYGPPPSGPVFPTKQHISTSYGPPPKPHSQYGPPKPTYGLPIKPAINFKPVGQTYGPPPPIRPPIISQSYGPPSLQHQSLPNFINGPKTHGCDGWKPIPGPAIPIPVQSIANSNIGSIQPIQSTLPDNSYLPPVSNNLPLADNSLHVENLHVEPLPGNLQLPVAEATNFNGLGDLGLGLTNINIVKSEGIELQSNSLSDSYSAPPPDSFGPTYQKPIFGLRPPKFPYSHSHGLGISPITSSFKQFPYSIGPPRQPIAFRPPVPQGLIESIGHSVQQKDAFGIKFQPQSSVYLPPPTKEIPPPPHGLESLPLANAAPFHSQQPKANLFPPQLPPIYAAPQFQQPFPQQYPTSSCSHGPNLANTIPQLQQVYGVPNQPLDVSHSSSFEIAQNTLQSNLLTSYGPPASGAPSGVGINIDALINEVHEPSSSYGPPPSGNPADSYAHSSQKSLSTVQAESSAATANDTASHSLDTSDVKVEDLPGLSDANVDIISAQKSHQIELPVQGEHGTYQLQFQAADPLASQSNGLGAPDHQKLLEGDLLQSILKAIEEPKDSNALASETLQPAASEHIKDHPDIKEFVNSAVGQETLAEVKAE